MAAQILDGKSLAAAVRAGRQGKRFASCAARHTARPRGDPRRRRSGLARLCPQQDARLRGNRGAARKLFEFPASVSRGGTAAESRGAERRSGDARHPRAAAAAAPRRRGARARAGVAREGRRRLPRREPGRPASPARPGSCLARRPASCACSSMRKFRSRGGTRWSSAARTSSASRSRCCSCKRTRPSPSAIRRPTDLAAITSQADVLVAAVGRRELVTARHGQTRGLRDRRRHQPRSPTASSSATSISTRCKNVAGWITPVPGGVGPMTVAMLSAQTRCAATELQLANPLLDFSGLPRFAEIKPEHVAPAVDAAARRGARGGRKRRAQRTRDLGRVRRAAGGRQRAPRPRLGPGGAPARGAGQPGAARGLQREPAQGHAVLDRARPEPGAVREVQGAAAPRREFASLPPGAQEASSRTRCATSASAARSCRRRRRQRYAADPGGAGARSRRSSPRTCSTPPMPFAS